MSSGNKWDSKAAKKCLEQVNASEEVNQEKNKI